jgi:hypothetical protein
MKWQLDEMKVGEVAIWWNDNGKQMKLELDKMSSR